MSGATPAAGGVPGQAFQSQPNYAAWRVEPGEFRRLEDLVRWAVLAPSSHNTQPWIFMVEADAILVAPDPVRALAVSDLTGREQYLSLGAAVANLKVAARRFSLLVAEELVGDGHAVAKRLSFSAGPEPGVEELERFEAIPRRLSNRTPHEPRELPDEFRDTLHQLAVERGLDLTLVEDAARKSVLGDLLKQADHEIMVDVPFTAELAAWLRPNSTRAFDGMPGFTFGLPDFMSRMFPAIARSGKMVAVGPENDRALIAERTAAVALISGPDEPASWLAAGELFQVANLEATRLGLATHVYAALIEREPYPERLRAALDLPGRPLMMFRVGYPSAEAAHAPRRPARSAIALGPEDARAPLREDRPTIFRLAEGHSTLDSVLAKLGEVEVVDRYAEDWLSELFVIRHPELDFRTPAGQQALSGAVAAGSVSAGVWVYYPWKRALVHLPDRDEFLELLFSRNFPTIDRDTQRRLAELQVGIGGLSVGSNIARSLAMLGIQRLRLADFDAIAPSNNNRLGAGSVLDVGRPKIEVLAQQLYEFNPFLDIVTNREGLHAHNLAAFLDGLAVFIDHLDDLPLKVAAREQARATGVIVLMATELAFTPLIDVDRPEDTAFFGGRVRADELEHLRERPEQFADFIRLAVTLFGGTENIPTSKLENYLGVVRGELNYVSQLGPTGYAAAGQLAYLVYEIARGRAGELAQSKRLHLEQPSLVDTEQRRRVIAAFEREFE